MLNWLKNQREKEAAQRKRLDELKSEIGELEQIKNSLLKENDEVSAHIDSMQKMYDGYGVLEETGYAPYKPVIYNSNIELKIFDIEKKIAEMAGRGELVYCTREYTVNGSNAKGKKFQDNYSKNILIGFNAYVDAKEKSVNSNNFHHAWELIGKSFNKFNKQGELIGISIDKKYLDMRLEMMKLKLQLKEKQREEKEFLRKEKRKMLEQEKLLAEIAKEEEKLKQEQKSMDIAFNTALSDKEREEIKAKMQKIDKRLESLEYRRQHNQSGWLYIISSPSLPNMVKIGVTRRWNPTIRVSELSSSSLPYPFISHGFVFSDDCFELEANVHKYFDNKRVAQNREFFYITPQETINALEEKFDQKVYSLYNPDY